MSVATPTVATLIAAAAAPLTARKEVPTFHEWFTGRFWREWLVGRRNKHTEVVSKLSIYEQHLKAAFGELRLDALRHTFGTHAALLGVNPWRLQVWLGHKRIDETMIYVHVAENHRREIPEHVLIAAAGKADPDRKILRMLGARGSNVAANAAPEDERAAKAAL